MSGKREHYKEKQSGKIVKRTQWASAAQRPVESLVQQGCLTRDLRGSLQMPEGRAIFQAEKIEVQKP